MTKIKVGLGQLNPTVGDIKGNAEKICSFIDQAEKEACDLVIFPELSLCGYPVWDLANKASFVRRNLKALETIARHTRGKRLTAVVGFIERAKKTKQRNFNCLAVIQKGNVIQKQPKSLLPTYDVFLEEIFFAPADSHKVFTLNGVCMGPTVCEDLWDDDYTKKPAKILKRKGARVLVNISASPYSKAKVRDRMKLVSRKARDNRVWILYVNQVGGQDDLVFDGRSFIVDPKGNLVFEADPFREGLFTTIIDLSQTKRAKRKAKKLSFEQEVHKALTLGLRDYIRKNGFEKVVIGLSGGIDSAIVATLACDALGPQSVIGVGMPGPYSSNNSLRDAEALARNLGIEFRVKPIKIQYGHFIEETILEKRRRSVAFVEADQISVAMENLQARLRGIQLMYISNDEGAMLLTTGNKSEIATGYSTLYGDMCGGLSVIGDVYKTDVYRLAQYRNSISPVIPESTLTKAPSAELKPEQTDQDSLPAYDILDDILIRYIEGNESTDEIAQNLKSKQVARSVIKKVLWRVDHNEYKRRQLPPALRITEKSWFGRRMPITNGFDG